MGSAFEYNWPRFAPLHDQSPSSTSRVDQKFCFTDAQTNAPNDLQTHATPIEASALVMANPLSQESPLVPDLGSTSDCSLFAPTPIQTPQDFQEPWILQAQDNEQEIDQILSLECAWDTSQGPRKYRMLAPKPTIRRFNPAAQDMQQQDLTTRAISPTTSSTARQPSPPAQPPGFVTQGQSCRLQRDAHARELLLQQPAVPDLDIFAGQQSYTHFRNGRGVEHSTQFALRQTVAETNDNFKVKSYHDDGLLDKIGSASQVQPPDSLHPGPLNDFDAFFDNGVPEASTNDFSSRPFLQNSRPTQPSTFPLQPPLNNQQLKMLDPQTQTGLHSNGLPHNLSLLPTNHMPNDIEPVADNQTLGNSDAFLLPLQSTAPLNVPTEDQLGPSSFNMQPKQSACDVAMPALPFYDDAFFGPVTQQQPWTVSSMAYLDQDDPQSLYPSPDELDNFGFLPSNSIELSANMAPALTDGARKPSPPTTPVKTNELGRRDTSRDEKLLELKNKGLSYKEIKEQHNFPEAESTLRGRFRTLTKTREDRVRKPEWKLTDISTLIAAVHSLAQASGITDRFVWIDGLAFLEDDAALTKVSWKKVAELMHEQGCYLYGNATTKKKYVQVRGERLGR